MAGPASLSPARTRDRWRWSRRFTDATDALCRRSSCGWRGWARSPLPVLLLVALTGCASSAGGDAATGTERTTRVRGLVIGDGDKGVDITTESAATERLLDASPAEVWGALVATYRDMGIQVTEDPEPQRRLRTTNLRVSRLDGDRMGRFFDCGTGTTGQRANYWDVTMSLVTTLDPVPGEGVRVVLELDAWARPRGTSGSAVHCPSRGELERRLLNAVTLEIVTGP